MASTVNIGTLQGVLAMRDEFSAQLQKFETRIKAVEDRTKGLSRSTKSESDKIKEAYSKVAASLDPVVARTQKYEKSVETLNRALKAGIISQSQYNAQLLKAQSHLQATTHWTQRLGASIASDLSSQLGRWFAISAAIGAVVGITKQLIDVTIEKERSERQLEAAIKRSAAASDISSQFAIELAESLSRLTGVDDDLIIAAEAVALRYNRISSQTFPAVTKAALDLAAATGRDLSSAMEFVAKMVNNPLRALTLLNREGYAVGKSQSDLIKHLLATNDILGAQGEILKILQGRYGDTAAEMRDTMGGALQALGTSWENLLEKMGEDHTGPIRDIIEAIIKMLDGLTDRIDHVAIAWNEFMVTLIRGDMIIQKFRGMAGADDATKKSADLRKQLAEREADLAKLYAKEMIKQGLLSEDLARKLGLLSSGHKKSSGAALEQTEAESKLNAELNRSRQVISQVNDDILRLLTQAAEQISAYKAAIQGQAALNEELLKQKVSHAILAEENKLRAIGKKLTSEQREQIELAIRATDNFKNRTDLLVQSWARLRSLSDIEIKLPDLSKVPSIQQSVMEIGVSIHATINEDFQREWDEFSDSVIESIKTDAEAIEEYELRVQIARDLARQAGDLERVAALEIELNRIREEGIMRQLDNWGTLFGQLGSMFGGFFRQLSQAISNIQSAYGAGKKLDASGFGSSMGMSGMWGGIFATAQIFYEIYKAVSADIKRDRARTWGDVTSLSVQGGQFSAPSYISQAGREMSFALEQMVRDLVDSLDAILKDLPTIVIRARRDGKEFSAYVAGVWVGTFRDAQQALEAAVSSAIQQADWTSISEEFRIALEASIGATMDELQRNLDTARAARGARLGEIGEQYVSIADQGRQEIEAMRALGLATDDRIASLKRELQALKNNVLGIDSTVSDQLAALNSLNKGIAEASTGMRASMQAQIDATIAQIEALERRGSVGFGQPGVGRGGGPGGRPGEGYGKDAQSEWEEALARLRAQLAEYIDELNAIPDALSDAEINLGIFDALYKYLEGDKRYAAEAHKYALMKVEIEFAAIKMQLIALGKWEEFAGMFDDALAAAREQAGRPVRRGGGGGERQSARDFVADRRFELSLSGMTDLQRARAEINKQYDDLLAQAGKDKKLRAELIDLRAKEIALLEKEERARVGKEFRDFIAPLSEFGNIRETANALIKDIENSPFGNARKAGMIGRVLAKVDEQITRLSKQEAAGLFGSMLSDMQKFGVSEQVMSKYRRSLVILEHTLNVENYRTRIAILKAEGNLAPAILEKLEEAFGIISNIDIEKWLDNIDIPDIEISGGDFSNAVDNVRDNLNRLAEAFKDAKDDIRDTLEEIARGEMGIVTPEAAFSAARQQYQDVIARAQSGELVGFQESSEVARNYIEALKAFSPELAATELANIQRDLSGLLDIKTVRDENLIYTEKFIKAQEKTNENLSMGFSDLSNQSQQHTQIQSSMLDRLTSINTNQAEMLNRLSALENAQAGRKMNA